MIIIAATREFPDIAFRLNVRSNPFSVFRLGRAIKVSALDYEGSTKYGSVSAFLDTWEIHASNRHNIRVPFLKRVHAMGDVAGRVFAFFRIYPTENCGCPDRKHWWNWLLAFVPVGYVEESTE